MELYSGTAVTKTAEIRVSRSIGALLIESDSTLAGLVNETITVFIERADGRNDQIATNIPLKAFILASTYGNASVDNSNGLRALCEIANMGGIKLGENEGIKFALSNLRAGQVYSVNGIEYPMLVDSPILFDQKKLLTEETSRLYEVQGYELCTIEGTDAISEVNLAYNNGNTVKLTAKELQAMAFDVDPVQEYGLSTVTQNATAFSISLVGVSTMDIYKTTAKPITLTLKSLTANDIQLPR